MKSDINNIKIFQIFINFKNLVFIGLILLFVQCGTCPDSSKFQERNVKFVVKLEDNFNLKDNDTVLVKKNPSLITELLGKYDSIYSFDTFIFVNNVGFFQIKNGIKTQIDLNITLPNYEFDFEFQPKDTSWLIIDTFKLEIIGAIQIVKIKDRCGKERKILEKIIWVNGQKVNLLKDEDFEEFSIKEERLFVRKPK